MLSAAIRTQRWHHRLYMACETSINKHTPVLSSCQSHLMDWVKNYCKEINTWGIIWDNMRGTFLYSSGLFSWILFLCFCPSSDASIAQLRVQHLIQSVAFLFMLFTEPLGVHLATLCNRSWATNKTSVHGLKSFINSLLISWTDSFSIL